MAREPSASGYVVEFPLRTVGVEGTEFFASGDASDLNIERMTFVEVGRRLFATEGK